MAYQNDDLLAFPAAAGPSGPEKAAGDPAGCPDRPVPGPLRPGGSLPEGQASRGTGGGHPGIQGAHGPSLHHRRGQKQNGWMKPGRPFERPGPTTNRHPGTWPRPRSIWPRLSVPWNRWPAVTAPLPPPGRPGPQPSKPLTCPKAASYVSWKRPLPRGKIGSNVSPICAPSAVPSWTRPGKPSVWPSAWNSFAPPPPLPFCRTRPI